MGRLAGFGAGVVVGAVAGALLVATVMRTPPDASAAPARPAPRTVCASTTAEAPASDATALRLRFCESRLAEKTRDQPTARRDWPEALPEADEPDAWQDAVDAALATCAPPLDRELTDCEEYPCVAALRPRPGVDPYAASAALSTCMEAELGDTFGDANGAMVVRARCPDGREEPVVLLTAATDDGLATVLTPPERDGLESIVYIGMTMGRRAESALQLWQCAEPR